MSFPHINKNKVVFVNLTEMDKYAGLEDGVRGGGKYVDQNGFGHELYNFALDSGKFYGYTPPGCDINLERISNEICRDEFGEYVDDVLVIFTCTRYSGGRVVCGFYLGARVYRHAVVDQRSSRNFQKNGEKHYANYNLVCEADHATLISWEDRKKVLYHANSNKKSGVGHGQHSVWYVDTEERASTRDDFIAYVESIINQEGNDELKYHENYREGRKVVATTNQLTRSREAREECIRLKGCYCSICEFDFEEEYGEAGRAFIEVHHITPIGKMSTSEDYQGTNPALDLIPVCSNCHSIIHRRKVPYSPEEVREMFSSH
jgi:5-methylcytosine-specific restriction protein A